eukprot:8171043-Alexandrium_andersonii.AAC.1
MQPPRYSGSFHADAERFGSHLTCDFIASKLDFMAGIHGARAVFVVKLSLIHISEPTRLALI